MPPRSLRRGDKCPNPGAVHKGCSRPKVLRFDSPLGGDSVFGTGQYSGNIIQGGVALQPQDYLLDGITPLADCIVVTGAATVTPDATTGAAWFSCKNLVVTGAAASLTASVNCKGLIGVVKGRTTLRAGATMHMSQKGKAGNFGNLTVFDLVPQAISRKLKPTLASYVVQGEGAAGGATTSSPGTAAGAMQTGGGGAGAAGYGNIYNNSGGKGGPCCGGAGSGGANDGATTAAGPYGGPGTAGYGRGGGGAGDPPGQSGLGAGGGLVMLFSAAFDAATGCIVSSDGADGAGADSPGGSAGGGCVVIVTKPGGYVNYGTVRANGGTAVSSSYHTAGPGGVGSVNIFALAA